MEKDVERHCVGNKMASLFLSGQTCCNKWQKT